MEYIPANLENGPVIRNRKTDKKITNAVRLNDNRSVTISQRKVIQLLTAKRYFKAQKGNLTKISKKKQPYVFKPEVITDGIPDNAIGDDGFSTFKPGCSPSRTSWHYDVKFEIDNSSDVAHGPVTDLAGYYGHDTGISSKPGHWSINKTPDKPENTGDVSDLRTYSSGKIEINDEYEGRTQREDPENPDTYV